MKENSKINNDLLVIKNNSIPAIIREQLERQIIAGQLTAGTHVSELQIANLFGVSRGPVREALRTLEGQGVLEQKKNCGWFIRTLSQQEVQDIFTFRQLLDNGLSLSLIKKAEQQPFQFPLAKLHHLINKMDKAANSNDIGNFALLNQDFHDELLVLSGNQRLRTTYRQIMVELASLVTEALTITDAMLISNTDHKNIIRSLEEQDFTSFSTHLYQHSNKTELRMKLITDIPQ